MRYRSIEWKAFITLAIILLSLATLSYGPSVSAAGHSVTKITLNPPTPNVLVHNQDVTVSFSYATTEPSGVRIFARPFVGGSAAPGYAASGAPISPTGSGTGTQSFTIIGYGHRRSDSNSDVERSPESASVRGFPAGAL